ncbi:MAG: polysaccharide deacetylase family protein [Desulfuromonadales bacterium]|nr:polysaccharide deacetylase family protein [Desulfuromonadales bacterium]
MYNAISIDVEDWFHICGLTYAPKINPSEWRVHQNIERILKILDETSTKATFFVLGSVAENIPDLVPEIASAGHEIASHGYSHKLVSNLTPAEFRDEIRKTHDILTKQAKVQPIGFRAPQWSLSPSKTPWGFEILIEEGYLYDSSINPLPFIGDKEKRRKPWELEINGRKIWEIPPMVTKSLLFNLPTGGGWGFRFFPLSIIENTVEKLNQGNSPAVIYIHPRELDPEGPRLKLPLLKGFVSYGSRKDSSQLIRHLLNKYRFIPVADMVKSWIYA